MARGTLRVGVLGLADVAGRGLEGGRGEADEVEPGHRGGDDAEEAVERRVEVEGDGARQSTVPAKIGMTAESRARKAATPATGIATRVTVTTPRG